MTAPDQSASQSLPGARAGDGNAATLAQALEVGMRACAKVALEAELRAEATSAMVDALIQKAKPESPIGRMRDALAAAPAASAPAGRERFEAYFAASRKSKGASKRPTFERFEDGTYKDDHTQRHWWTWQQASAFPSPVTGDAE